MKPAFYLSFAVTFFTVQVLLLISVGYSSTDIYGFLYALYAVIILVMTMLFFILKAVLLLLALNISGAGTSFSAAFNMLFYAFSVFGSAGIRLLVTILFSPITLLVNLINVSALTKAYNAFLGLLLQYIPEYATSVDSALTYVENITGIPVHLPVPLEQITGITLLGAGGGIISKNGGVLGKTLK